MEWKYLVYGTHLGHIIRPYIIIRSDISTCRDLAASTDLVKDSLARGLDGTEPRARARARARARCEIPNGESMVWVYISGCLSRNAAGATPIKQVRTVCKGR
jgi:hypothetical protein